MRPRWWVWQQLGAGWEGWAPAAGVGGAMPVWALAAPTLGQRLPALALRPPPPGAALAACHNPPAWSTAWGACIPHWCLAHMPLRSQVLLRALACLSFVPGGEQHRTRRADGAEAANRALLARRRGQPADGCSVTAAAGLLATLCLLCGSALSSATLCLKRSVPCPRAQHLLPARRTPPPTGA